MQKYAIKWPPDASHRTCFFPAGTGRMAVAVRSHGVVSHLLLICKQLLRIRKNKAWIVKMNIYAFSIWATFFIAVDYNEGDFKIMRQIESFAECVDFQLFAKLKNKVLPVFSSKSHPTSSKEGEEKKAPCNPLKGKEEKRTCNSISR